jgi:thiol-disulfide isomerase/thioredoxin
MGYLFGAIVFCSLLMVISILLNLGVIRRLREHEKFISEIRSQQLSAPDLAIKPGESPARFEAVDIDGRELTSETIGPSRVSFFTPNCPGCDTTLPEFLEQAREARTSGEQVIAVVVGREPAAADYVERIRGLSQVVREDYGGSVSTAFRVRGFPVTVLLDEHGTAVANLSGSASAARTAAVP